MIFKKILFVLLTLILFSCGKVDFVHKNDNSLTNPIYNKVNYIFSGKEISSNYKYASIYFGSNSENKYRMEINIDENTTRRSVETNQVTSKLDYELKFTYNLESIADNCLLFSKIFYSRFSHVPKSEGYNYGSDQSLENMYELAVEESFSNFINYVSDKDITKCLNES